MPYIPKVDKEYFDSKIGALLKATEGLSDGEITYVIYKLILEFLKQEGNPTYKELAKCMGILECVKQEFYRKIVSPYEDKKIIQNGDILL